MSLTRVVRFCASVRMMMSSNCLGSASRPCGADGQLVGGRGVAERRRADGAGGDVEVVVLERGDDVVRRQPACGRLVGVDPDTHRVIARTPDVDVAHPLQPEQRVADAEHRVVGDILLIQTAVWREQVHHQQQVGRGLPDRQPQRLHLGGQLRHRGLDAVLHQHGRGVEIGAERERDGERHVAVAGGRGRHIEHLLDAVDLLLQRLGHLCLQVLRAGAGVGRGHRNGRRHDLGILRDGQRRVGEAADDQDQDGDDGGEHRSVDEEVGKPHWPGCGMVPGGGGSMCPWVARTLAPALAEVRPSMTMLSSALMPERMTRRLPIA